MLRANLAWIGALWLLLLGSGCGSTAQRAAMEQLLVSDAVDQAIGQIDFSPLQGKRVFLDPEYVRTVRPLGFVNSDYVISSLRHQIVAAGCKLKDRREEAEIIIEPRVGSLGTDDYNIVYGLPRSEAAAIASAATNSGISFPAVPEIALGKSEYRQGFAKITVFAYRAEDREAVWQSGVAKSTATSRDTWVMGAGPFQKGTIYRDKQLGGFSRVANFWSRSRPPEKEPDYLLSGVYPDLVDDQKFELLAQADTTSNRSTDEAASQEAATPPTRDTTPIADSAPPAVDPATPDAAGTAGSQPSAPTELGSGASDTPPRPLPFRPALDFGQPRRL